MSVQRGDVVVIDFPRAGQPHRKVRPAVVVSNNVANQAAGAVTVALVIEWSENKARLPICVEMEKGVAGAVKRSVVDCGQIHTVDKDILKTTGAALPPVLLSQVDDALRVHLDLLD